MLQIASVANLEIWLDGSSPKIEGRGKSIYVEYTAQNGSSVVIAAEHLEHLEELAKSIYEYSTRRATTNKIELRTVSL